MEVRFGHQVRLKELSRQLNESKDYERSAKDWDGDFIFIVEPDAFFHGQVYLYLGLLHGKSPDAAMVASETERKAEFTIRAPFGTWRKVIEGKLAPIQAMMNGKLKLRGNLMKVVRYPKAAKEIITCCSKMPTDSGEQPQK